MLVRTRYFFVGSALILAVGLCAGLVAYYSGNLPLRASTIGPAELTYLPAATTGVAYANVREIMNSDFRKKLSTMLPAGAGKHTLLSETGIDIDQDIDSVVAGIQTGGSSEIPVVFLRGRFDSARIETVATTRGATREQHEGRSLLVFQREGPSTPAIAFLESDLVALGDAAALRRAIDVSVRRESVVERPEIMKLVAAVDGAGNAWAIGRLDALTEHRVLPEPVSRALPSVEWVSATFDVGRAVNGRLRADAADDATGEQLRSVVNGAVSAARMVAANDPRLAAALSSVRTSGSGPTVELSFTVPQEMIDLIHAPKMPQPR
jgi:hypothetical protein